MKQRDLPPQKSRGDRPDLTHLLLEKYPSMEAYLEAIPKINEKVLKEINIPIIFGTGGNVISSLTQDDLILIL